MSDALPREPKEIKPHPYGIELGRLIQMLNSTESRTLLRFLADEFSSVGNKTALGIIELARKQGVKAVMFGGGGFSGTIPDDSAVL